MRVSRIVVAAGAVIGLVVAVAACSGSTDAQTGAACHSGDQQACTCSDGSHGSASCVNGAFAACQCAGSDGGGGNDASSTTDGATMDAHEGGAAKTDAGFGMYMGPCNTTSDCPMGGVCFTFPTKGSFCTHSCMTNADCQAPSPKCTPRGVCAVPD